MVTHDASARNFARLTILFLATALWLNGCAARVGSAVVSYDVNGNKLPNPATIDRPGRYALLPAEGVTPLYQSALHKGDQVGFHTGDDGRIHGYVITGGRTEDIPLLDVLASAYVWKYEGQGKRDE